MAKKKVETKAKPKTEKTVQTKVTAQPVAAKQDTGKVLRKWNLILAGVFALQAVLIAALSNAKAVPIVVHYPAVDTLATEANKHEVLAVASRQLFDMPIAYLLAAGLLVFAVIHLLAATRFQKQYQAVVDRGVNTARWLAYGVGGLLLMDAVYLLSGINSLATLKLLDAALLGACAAALAVELLGPGRPGLSRLLKVMAVVGGVLPWLAIAGVLMATTMFDGKLPSYLYGVYTSGFILMVAIVLATSMRWQRRGRWANTLYSEKMFLLLGLATATVLAWQIFAGALL